MALHLHSQLHGQSKNAQSENQQAMRIAARNLAIAAALVSAAGLSVLPSQAQSAGDIVVVGGSPGQWSQNQAYWNQLLQLNRPQVAPPAPGVTPSAGAAPAGTPADQAKVDPQALEKQLLRNISVSGLKLEPIIRLNGSSQVSGSVTNNNRKPVTVSGVNYQVLDANGQVLQTGAAVPKPSTIGPGQTVTFQDTLLTVPADVGAQVRLSNPAVSLQGGV
jgi:hypothetical protein